MGRKPISIGLVVLVSATVVLVLLSAYGVFVAARLGGYGALSLHGWIAMALAAVLSAALTFGFVMLAVYSDRSGFDDQDGPHP